MCACACLCTQLLELSALCLRCEVGRLLCDSRCWEIFQTCHKITCQERVSSLLGNTAGNTLAHIVLMVFSRARQPRTPHATQHSPSSKSKHKAITTATATATASATTAAAGSSATAAATTAGVDSNSSSANTQQQQQQSAHSSSATTTAARLHTGNDSDSSSSSSADECVLVDDVDTGNDGGDEHTEQFQKEQFQKEQFQKEQLTKRRRRRRTHRDHSAASSTATTTTNNSGDSSSSSLNALVEIMRFLSRLSNPRENSEETCILSLSLINIALEAGGVQLGQHKALVEVNKHF
jgi:hypothetical protein